MATRLARTAAAALAMLAGGCALGIVEGDPKVLTGAREVPIPYQEAHRRAEAHARTCHQSATNRWTGGMAVNAVVYSDTRSGVVRVTMPGHGTDLETIEVNAIDENRTQVVVREWGRGIRFDEADLEAALKSVATGSAVCR